MKLLALALALAGCVSAPLDPPLVRTLYVENVTDSQVTVYADRQRLGIVGPMQGACLPMPRLPLAGDITLYFRALAGRVLAARPADLTSANGWSIMLIGTQTDQSFFPYPTERCLR